MPEARLTSRVARFGVFEADLHTCELRRKGRKIGLQEQPFQILAMLLERPGEMRSREEMRQKLWPGDVFVDFDHGLNAAIAKLRRALGDLAESPRYVETVSRHGYRFLAPVEWLDGGDAAAPAPGTTGGLARVICEGRTIPLHQGENIIGRNPDCEICVDSSTVSRRHARLIVAGHRVTLEDLGSKNGSFVGGQRLSEGVLLADGDEIQTGVARIIFRSASLSPRTSTHRKR